jgi:lysine 2,3-aminomutase
MQTWQEIFKNALKTPDDLESFFNQSFAKTHYPIFIPRPFAQKIKDLGLNSALARQFLPHQDENLESGFVDPIGDHARLVKGQLIHRYQNRVLFLPTAICPIQCRYCFRKNELHHNDEIFKRELNEVVSYLNSHPEIEEVIFTGGDPLILSNEKLLEAIEVFKQTPVKYLRFHTRTPVIIPERIDNGFLEVMDLASQSFTRVHLVIHTNHITEMNDLFFEKIKLLKKTQVELLSQTVLLKDVNDNLEDLSILFKKLVDIDVRPYYLHHPDKVKGGMHFYLDTNVGKKLYTQLRQILPGWALPHYVIDNPKGTGKTEVMSC